MRYTNRVDVYFTFFTVHRLLVGTHIPSLELREG